jgi:hypothetical protein
MKAFFVGSGPKLSILGVAERQQSGGGMTTEEENSSMKAIDANPPFVRLTQFRPRDDLRPRRMLRA